MSQALDITLSGFLAFQAHGGALDNLYEERLSTGLDFSNDTEVHVILRGRDDATGLDYGGTIELEADTDATENAGETWIFVRGALGELRFGDEDGPVDASAIGGYTIAAGTGGIDGEVIDALTVDAVLPSNSGEATKIRYYTPSFAGVQLGLSYTPNVDEAGDSLATDDVAAGDWVEAALVYEGLIARHEIQASVVGSVGQAKEDGGQRIWTWYAGAAGELPLVEAGLGFGMEDVAGREKRYANAGIGRELGRVYASLTYGRVLATSGQEGVGEPWNLVLSADLELMPGLVLAGDVAWFDNDLDRGFAEETGGDDGVAWVTRLELAF
jgi:outer membrane protein OmpU